MTKDFWQMDVELAPYTMLRIGGRCDYFLAAKAEKEMIGAVKEARRLKLPVTILGWGSNVLISDKGVRGLVIKNEVAEMKVGQILPTRKNDRCEARWQGSSFSDLDYDESGWPRVRVTLSSGFPLPTAINELLDRGITGLQWFARIPGTIGGAVHNNIHGGTHFFAEYVHRVKVLTPAGKIRWLGHAELDLAYDQSRFHTSGEIILAVELDLYRGGKQRAQATAFEWAKRKSLQPPRSAGCTFKNISNEDKERLGLPTTSVGYLVEQILGMSGYKVGGAKVSPVHHNFIVNAGKATAADYLAVMREIQKRAKEKLGLALEPEIILLGEF